jgi:hypothetical protein
MSAPMVLAILDDRKTQTRRIIKPEHLKGTMCAHDILSNLGPQLLKQAATYCPHGQVGDQLWVKETYRHFGNSMTAGKTSALILYRADNRSRTISLENPPTEKWWNSGKSPWKPSIFMPRWASRITLEITDVRVERLQDISEEDAKTEGVHVGQRVFLDDPHRCRNCDKDRALHIGVAMGCPQGLGTVFDASTYRGGYKFLWNSINGKDSWDLNPWCWCLSFRRIKP